MATTMEHEETTRTAPWNRGVHAVPAFRRLERRAEALRDGLADAVEERSRSARRAVRRARYAAEDLTDAAALRIRHDPLRAAGVTAAVMFIAGALVGWTLRRTKRG